MVVFFCFSSNRRRLRRIATAAATTTRRKTISLRRFEIFFGVYFSIVCVCVRALAFFSHGRHKTGHIEAANTWRSEQQKRMWRLEAADREYTCEECACKQPATGLGSGWREKTISHLKFVQTTIIIIWCERGHKINKNIYLIHQSKWSCRHRWQPAALRVYSHNAFDSINSKRSGPRRTLRNLLFTQSDLKLKKCNWSQLFGISCIEPYHIYTPCV